MTLPVGGISLTVETSGVKRGKEEFKQAAQEMKASAQGVEAEFEKMRAEARLLEEGLRKLGVPAEAIAAQMQKMGVASQTAAGQQGVGATIAVVDQAGRSATTATPAFRKLEGSLQMLALSAAGLPGPVGQVARALSAFTLGGGGVAGLAVVGLAAIVKSIAILRQEAEDARRPLEELAERAAALRGERTGDIRLAADLAAATQGAIEARAEVEKLEAAIARISSGAGSPFQKDNLIRGLRDNLVEAQQQLDRFSRDAAEFQAETTRRAEEAAEQSRRKAREAEAERLRLLRLQREELEKQRDIFNRYAETLARFNQDFGRGGATVINPVTGEQSTQGPASTRPVQKYQEALEAFDQAGLKLIDTAGRLKGAMGALSDEERRRQDHAAQLAAALEEERQLSLSVADGFVNLVSAMEAAPDALVNATRAAVYLVDALSAPKFNPADVASAGFGIAASLVDGIFGSADRAREAALAAQEAARNFQRAVDAFKAIGSPLSSFEGDRQRLEDQFQDLITQALDSLTASGYKFDAKFVDFLRNASVEEIRKLADQYGGLFKQLFDNLFEPLQRNRDAIEALIAAENQRFDQDLRVRELVATGREAEAASLRRQFAAEQELAEARKTGFDEARIAELERIQALEAEAEAIRQATAEAERRADVARSLDQRELQARKALGENVDAQIKQAQREAEIEAAIRQGYTEAEIDRIRYIQGLEAEAEALEEIARQHEEAARLLRFNTTLTEDLTARYYEATDDPRAKAYRRELEKEREIQEAIANGASEANVNWLRWIQGLEDEKAIRDALIKQQEEAVRLYEEEARAREDLVSRDLRSRGLSDAADATDFYNRQAREREDAIAKGFSQDYLNDLYRIQAQERQARADTLAQRDLDAFNRGQAANAPTLVADSNATVSLGVGVSGSQIDRLSGTSTSMFVLQQRYLPLLTELVTHTGLLRKIAGQPAAADQVVADLTDAERSIGLNPSNN